MCGWEGQTWLIQTKTKSPVRRNRLPEVRPQLFTAGCMAKTTDRFFLDLPDPLSRELEFFTDLLERQRVFTPQPEVQANDFRLPLRQRPESTLHFFAQ